MALAFRPTRALAALTTESTDTRACSDEYRRTVVCAPVPDICNHGKCLCAD